MAEPRPKKFCKLKPGPPLPILGGDRKIVGKFDQVHVVIENDNDMRQLISMGCFGKASFSRNYPQFETKSGIIRNRVFLHRKKLGDKAKASSRKVIVIPDSSDSDDDEEYFTNLKPSYEMDRSGIKEEVCLTLEEAFFLAVPIGCLTVMYLRQVVAPDHLWEVFSETEFFVQNYITYYHYRSKNWVVKTGIKYGGDFILYKQGPPFFHASYVVVIEIVDENFRRIETLTKRSMTVEALTGLNRLCEATGKELLVCQIVWPGEVNYKDLSNITVKDVLMKRWLSSQKRQIDVN